MKKILFLGAGFHQSYAIQRARALGYYTIAIDHLENSIGFEYAHQKVKMDVTNLQGCLAVAQINQVHRVMNSYLDTTVMTATYIIRKMNLPGIDAQVVQSVKGKFTLRSFLCQSKIPQSEEVYLLSQVDELKDLLDFIHFPVLVKPLGRSEEASLSKKANNIEVIQTADQKYHIVNIKLGVGGSIISSHIIPEVLRYNYIDNAILAAVSDPFEIPEIHYTRNIVAPN